VHPESTSRGTPIRIAVLTIGGRYGVLVLRALHARGIVPAAVVIESRTSLRDCFHKRTALGRTTELPLVPARALWRWLRPRLRRDLRIGARVVVTGPLNSEAMRRDLVRLRPDLLVLAGTGIVSPDLLGIPRLGTVNVHLALLPWIRGNDVIAHSLLYGIPLGVTCHLVDPGIDTGPVLVRRLLDPTSVEPSLGALEEATIAAGVHLLADVVADAARTGRLPVATTHGDRFALFRFLDAARRADADALARRGRARELYAQLAESRVNDVGDLPAAVHGVHDAQLPRPAAGPRTTRAPAG
jgi:hypothetical protein